MLSDAHCRGYVCGDLCFGIEAIRLSARQGETWQQLLLLLKVGARMVEYERETATLPHTATIWISVIERLTPWYSGTEKRSNVGNKLKNTWHLEITKFKFCQLKMKEGNWHASTGSKTSKLGKCIVIRRPSHRFLPISRELLKCFAPCWQNQDERRWCASCRSVTYQIQIRHPSINPSWIIRWHLDPMCLLGQDAW